MTQEMRPNRSKDYRGEKVDGVEVGGRPLLIRDDVDAGNVLRGQLERGENRLEDLDRRRIHHQDTPQERLGLRVGRKLEIKPVKSCTSTARSKVTLCI